MSAERLREAARVLRERAEAATPGPWLDVAGAWGLPSNGPDHMRVLKAPHRDASTALARLEYDQQGGSDAAYIATMHPGVGLALADWLDEVAGWREEGLGLIPYGNLGDAWTCIERQANVVADLILGDAP